MLELKDALLEVDGRRLFAPLSLIAREGQLTCVSGPHGVGKTLLVRAMLGLQPLAGGFVSIDGELITPQSAPVFRRFIGYLPQAVLPAAVTFVPPTDDLESVWAPDMGTSRPRAAKPVDALQVAIPPLSAKQLIIADDPEPSQAEELLALAAGGRTVIVMSQRQEFLDVAHQKVTIEPQFL